ncbi:MAG: hypothetical protein HY562_03895 [Ignavibacteriales bacterium]|nr:hypothetical protein [Ignavibacteriales bacterium]
MAGLVKEAQVLYDAKGKKSHVVLLYRKYEQLLEMIEDALDLKAMQKLNTKRQFPGKLQSASLKGTPLVFRVEV